MRMHPTFQFSHTYGYRAQRFLCLLLFPQASGQTCDHQQFHKKKGCVKGLNWEAGGVMRVMLDRDGPLYHGIYTQRTSAERINSQAQALGIERPSCAQWALGRQPQYLDLSRHQRESFSKGTIDQCSTSTNTLVATLERAPQAI